MRLPVEPDARRRDSLVVNEIFFSIQGESTYAGCPCVFVRLTGCDLRCQWCDTEYAFHEGTRLSVEEVLEQVAAYGCSLVEITGGEPLLQQAVIPLMERLLATGNTVLLETGGHRSIASVPPGVVKIVDVKCPTSGEAERTCWANLALMQPHDQLKFVIANRTDYEFAREVIRARSLEGRFAALLLSPVHSQLPLDDMAAWVLKDNLHVRFQLQLHKYIWGALARGV